MRRSWLLVAALVAAASAVAAAGCTIPRDDQPQAISRDALPAALFEPAGTSTTIASATRTERATLFFTRAGGVTDAPDTLIPTETEVAVPRNPREFPKTVIDQLLKGPTKEQAENGDLRTAIPDTAQLLDTQLDGDVLTLNLANVGTIEGTAQRQAVAQLVFTATQHPPSAEYPTVRAVKFQQRGVPVAVPLEKLTSNPDDEITRESFPVQNARMNATVAASTTSSLPAG